MRRSRAGDVLCCFGSVHRLAQFTAPEELFDRLRLLLGVRRAALEALGEHFVAAILRALDQPARERSVFLERAVRAPERDIQRPRLFRQQALGAISVTDAAA